MSGIIPSINKKLLRLFQLLPFWLVLHTSAQSCGPCASAFSTDTLCYRVYQNDTSTYTLRSGKTLCIFKAGRFSGRVILNGGCVCNKGNFAPKALVINSGSIVNSNNANIPSVTLGSGKSITNSDKSILTISGNLTLSGGTFYNSGLLNVKGSIQNTSGTFLNRSIINCVASTGSGSITNLGIINTD